MSDFAQVRMMTPLDPAAIRRFTGAATRENLASLVVLPEIASTNSYLLQKPAPPAGRMSVVVTNNQTAGRGRHGKSWRSPPGSGLCLSTAYCYTLRPDNLSALTLAAGLAAATALDNLGAGDVQVKWPNDLVAAEGKLGGILVETRASGGDAVTVVIGIGINISLPEVNVSSGHEQGVLAPTDLRKACAVSPAAEKLAGAVVTELYRTFAAFGTDGFKPFHDRWSDRDWLAGRTITVDESTRQSTGIAAGIDIDGALLLDPGNHDRRRITSGSIVAAAPRAD